MVIGSKENWETALAQPMPIWGLRPSYRPDFSYLSPSDFLWFYVKSPIKGIIGVGSVKDKYVDLENLVWEDEIKRGKTIWPLRFRIHVLKVLPHELWKSECIKINDFNLFWQKGFQPLSKEYVEILLKRFSTIFEIKVEQDFLEGATISSLTGKIGEKKLPYATRDVHRELQESIAEIGKLQDYYTELEYKVPLAGEYKSLDVIWKRELKGVPTFAFEVELSQMLEKAVARLKFAFTRWNSRPRLIIPSEHHTRASNLLTTEERFFSTELKL